MVTNEELEKELDELELAEAELDKKPFTKAPICLIVGEQGGGKSTVMACRAVDATYKRLTRVRLFLGKDNEGNEHYYDVKARPVLNDKGYSIVGYAMIYLPNEEPFVAEVPENACAIADGLRIFYNGHYYGINYMHVELADIIENINSALFMDGIINVDEGYIGGGNRTGMTVLGDTITKFQYQIRKRRIYFNIASPQDGIMDTRFRTTRTERIVCSYNEDTFRITTKIQKAKKQEKTIDFDPRGYWKYFRTEERFKQPENKLAKAYQQSL
jgi:hypothetical protein